MNCLHLLAQHLAILQNYDGYFFGVCCWRWRPKEVLQSYRMLLESLLTSFTWSDLADSNYSPLRKEGGRKKENGRRKEESLRGKRKKVGRGRSPKEKGRGFKGQESEGKRPWGRRWWRGRWGKLFEFILCCKKSYWMSMDFWPMHITKYLCLKPYESLNIHPDAQSCTPCFSLFGIQEEEETEQVDDNLEKCNIIELKDKLRAMNLPVSGRKAELIQRIRNAKW